MLSSPEETIGLIGIFGLACAGTYAFGKWLLGGPRSPDPWGADIEQSIEAEGCRPVCPHCLTLQTHNGWFCPNCGAMCGQYGNYLPAVYVFSIGEAVRAGAGEASRRPVLVTAGCVLLAFAYFSLLAPIYCFFLLIKSPADVAQSDPEPPKTDFSELN